MKLAAFLPLAAAQSGCFPGYSDECCAAIKVAEADPAIGRASMGLLDASGEAEAAAFSQCNAARSPCTVVLENGTQVTAGCCSADSLAGWQSPGPAAAVAAMRAAGDGTPGGGNTWWIHINQIVNTPTASIDRTDITHQYVNWYPAACTNATAIAEQQNMMCQDPESHTLECHATAEKAVE